MLRLALYSDQLCAANQLMDERLLRLIGVERPRIGYISSAPDASRYEFAAKKVYYQQLGAELALYADRDSEAAVLAALLVCDAIHLSGGNTYEFSAWLQQRGWLAPLERYAREQGVLIGVSAGSILMTPAIATAALCGDIADPAISTYQTLSLVSFGFRPHFDPAHGPDSAFNSPGWPKVVYACPDGAGIVINGNAMEVFGTLTKIEPSL